MKIAVTSFDTSGPDPGHHAIIRLCISIVEFHSCEVLDEFSERIVFRTEMADAEYLTAAGYTPEVWTSDAAIPQTISADAVQFLRDNGTIPDGDSFVSRLAVLDFSAAEFLVRWFGRLQHESLPFDAGSTLYVQQFAKWQHEMYPHHVRPKDWSISGLHEHFTAGHGSKLVGAADRQGATISILAALKLMEDSKT